MSFEITTAMVKQYSANVWHLSQQKGSRLQGMVRNETQNGEFDFYDNIGVVSAQKKVGRHSDTVYSDTPHGRRKVSTAPYVYADLCDKEDKLRTLQSPEGHYAKAAINALGRSIDDIIIEAALGTAYSGKEGATAVELSNDNRIAGIDGSTTTGVGLTLDTLRKVKLKFNANDVEEGELYFAISAIQLDNMLGQEKITSQDYAAVKALVQGDIDTFMGFKFVRLERLPVTSAAITYNVVDGSVGAGTGTLPAGARRCFAWKKDGILLAKAAGITARFDELPTKHYSTQVYASMDMGATRMEEVKVVEVFCKE